MHRLKCLAHLFIAASLSAVLPAHALVGGAVVDPNTSDSPWAGVVSITPTTNGAVYSGALLDRYHVLTAAHVAAGFASDPGKLKININAGGNLTQQIVASHVFVHPDYYTGNRPNDATFAWNDDIAVIRLAAPAADGVPVYSLFPDTPSQPIPITLVAYGGYSDGTKTTIDVGSNAAVKRVGQNVLTGVFPADDEGEGTPANVYEGFTFVFDGPASGKAIAGESGYAGGDSGSPVFVNDNGVWRILGVGAFNGDPANVPGGAIQFGAIGGGMLIAPYASWIQTQMTSPVPEPETYALLLAGLGVVAAATARRRRTKTR